MRTDNGLKDLVWEVSKGNFKIPERFYQDCSSIFWPKNIILGPTGVERSSMISKRLGPLKSNLFFLGHLRLDINDEKMSCDIRIHLQWYKIFWKLFPQNQYTKNVVQKGPWLQLELPVKLVNVLSVFHMAKLLKVWKLQKILAL